jgi:hypothetical protein
MIDKSKGIVTKPEIHNVLGQVGDVFQLCRVPSVTRVIRHVICICDVFPFVKRKFRSSTRSLRSKVLSL